MSLTLLPDSEKLDTKNWSAWKRTMTSIPRMKGLMIYAGGDVRSPQNTPPPHCSSFNVWRG